MEGITLVTRKKRSAPPSLTPHEKVIDYSEVTPKSPGLYAVPLAAPHTSCLHVTSSSLLLSFGHILVFLYHSYIVEPQTAYNT